MILLNRLNHHVIEIHVRWGTIVHSCCMHITKTVMILTQWHTISIDWIFIKRREIEKKWLHNKSAPFQFIYDKLSKCNYSLSFNACRLFEEILQVLETE